MQKRQNEKKTSETKKQSQEEDAKKTKLPRELTKNEDTQTSNHKKEEKTNQKQKTMTIIIGRTRPTNTKETGTIITRITIRRDIPPPQKKEIRTCPYMRLFSGGKGENCLSGEKKEANKKGKNKANPRCLSGKNEEPHFLNKQQN